MQIRAHINFGSRKSQTAKSTWILNWQLHTAVQHTTRAVPVSILWSIKP